MSFYHDFEESMGDAYDRIRWAAKRVFRRLFPKTSRGILGYIRRHIYADEEIKNAAEAIAYFQRTGFYCRFTIQPTCLQCPELELILYPDEFDIQFFYRFPDKLQESGHIIVYAIRTHKGVKGIFVNREGNFPAHTNPELIEKLRMRE